MGNPGIGVNMENSGTDLFAVDNLRARINFGYRAAHVAALAGKAITRFYYGYDESKPLKSMFIGCSTGGYQALVEAQRFPWDFDGIVVGAPGSNLTGIGMYRLWALTVTLGKDGKSVLGLEDIRRVHEAALARCDMDD